MINQIFILGGNNAGMTLIAQLLRLAGERFVQPDKSHGEHKLFAPEQLGLMTYSSIIPGFSEPFIRITGDPDIIFVECGPANGRWDFRESDKYSIINFDGSRSGSKASTFQVLDLLETTFSDATRRWAELVDAHGVGYIPAMHAIGASDEEIQRVCALERASQGITAMQEYEAETFINLRKVSERLVVIRLPHNKWSTVTDRLSGKYDQLLILSAEQQEAIFYGDAAICNALCGRFQGTQDQLACGDAGRNAFWTTKISPSHFDGIRDLIYLEIQSL